MPFISLDLPLTEPRSSVRAYSHSQKLKPIGEHCGELRALCMPLLTSGNAGLRGRAWSLFYHTLEWQYLTYRVAFRSTKDKEWISSASVDYLMCARPPRRHTRAPSARAACMCPPRRRRAPTGEPHACAHYAALASLAHRYSGWVTLAAHWLRMEQAAVHSLAKGGDEEPDFYNAKVQTSAYVFDRLLARTRSHKAGMLADLGSVMAMPAANFSFDHSR